MRLLDRFPGTSVQFPKIWLPQEHRRSKVFAALGPVALGHLISIATVVVLIGWARFAAASPLLRPAGAAILILFAKTIRTSLARKR